MFKDPKDEEETTDESEKEQPPSRGGFMRAGCLRSQGKERNLGRGCDCPQEGSSNMQAGH